MGGVVAGCFSAIDGMQRIENVHMKKIRENGVVTTAVDNGEGYLIRRSNSAAKMSRDEINAKFTADQSMPLMLKAACKKFGNKNALGFRKIVKSAKEKITDEKGNEKDWEFLYLSDTEYMTFNTLWEKVVALANGLASSGVKAGGKVALYEETRWEWLVSCYAIWTLGATPVTVYANLGEDALVYALKEAEVDAVICNAKAVKKLITLCCKNEINIETVIATDMNTPIENSESNTKILAWESVVDAGAGKEIPETMSQSTEDLALIMYTSGTTGDPKGVMLTQGNVLAAVSGLDHRLAEILSNVENPSYCAYLPLAHILEFAAENVMLKNGFLLGYGNPRTLTNTSARPHGDLQEFKPVFFAGVPRIFDTIKKAVEGKLPPEGSLKRQVFERAFAERKDALLKGQDTPFFSKKVFTPLAALLGGRVRYIVSGGAPLSAKTQEWLSIVFGTNTATNDPFCCVGQGYGLTETGAACTLQDFGDHSFETAGRLLQCCEVKLRTVEEFRVTDEPPRGEILIRGPTISQGYYKQAEKTREAFLEDGFFATGDVGSFDKKGYLKIVGRVKALAKNAHGEYIAMEALESMYVQNSLVLPNGICVVVDPHQPFIVAVALTDQAKAMSFCKEKNIEGSWPEVLQDEKFRKAAIASLGVTAKENGKKPFETLKNVRFYSDEWTPENGILTAAMKLKRREIDAKYGDDIKAMFASA